MAHVHKKGLLSISKVINQCTPFFAVWINDRIIDLTLHKLKRRALSSRLLAIYITSSPPQLPITVQDRKAKLGHFTPDSH